MRPDRRSSDWLADLTMPASDIVGTRDAFGTVDRIQHLAAEIDADVTVIPDAGHLPWLDEPDLVTDAILDRVGLPAPRAEAPTPHRARWHVADAASRRHPTTPPTRCRRTARRRVPPPRWW